MPVDGTGDRLLLLVRQRTQGVGQGHPEPAFVDLLLERLAELLGQGQPLHDPAPLPAADLGDGGRSQVLGSPQVPDHPSLVHRRERARRTVGLEHRDLLLHRRARPLHHHRHLAQAELTPARQALEAVEQLVVSALGRDDPQRNRGELLGAHRRRSARASQSTQSRLYPRGVNPLQPGPVCGPGQHRRRRRFVPGGPWRAHRSSPSQPRPGRALGSGRSSTWRKPSLAWRWKGW